MALNTECHFAESLHAKCHKKPIMLNNVACGDTIRISGTQGIQGEYITMGFPFAYLNTSKGFIDRCKTAP
jgi:hypothetical protein